MKMNLNTRIYDPSMQTKYGYIISGYYGGLETYIFLPRKFGKNCRIAQKLYKFVFPLLILGTLNLCLLMLVTATSAN